MRTGRSWNASQGLPSPQHPGTSGPDEFSCHGHGMDIGCLPAAPRPKDPLLQLQQQNKALLEEVQHLRQLLALTSQPAKAAAPTGTLVPEQCASSGTEAAAAAAAAGGGGNPGTQPSCICHDIANCMTSNVGRSKALIAQLQRQVLVLEAELANRTEVVLETDAILAETERRLGSLQQLQSQQPLAAGAAAASAAARPSSGTHGSSSSSSTRMGQDRRRLGSSGVAAGGAVGRSSASGQQQQQQVVVVWCQQVLSQAVELQRWAAGMKARLARTRAAAGSLFSRRHTADRGSSWHQQQRPCWDTGAGDHPVATLPSSRKGSTERPALDDVDDTVAGCTTSGRQQDDFSSSSSELQHPGALQYVPAGGNKFLPSQTQQQQKQPQQQAAAAAPESAPAGLAAGSKGGPPLQDTSSTTSSSSSRGRKASPRGSVRGKEIHTPDQLTLLQLCKGQGLAASDIADLHKLEVRLSALAPQLATLALQLRTLLLPLVPWLAPAAAEALSSSASDLAAAVAAAAGDLNQLCCLLPAWPLLPAGSSGAGSGCCAGDRWGDERGSSRSQPPAAAAAAAAAAAPAGAAAGAGAAEAGGHKSTETADEVDGELGHCLQQLQALLAAAASAGSRNTCMGNKGLRPSPGMPDQQWQQQQRKQQQQQQQLEGALLLLREVARQCWQQGWRGRMMEAQLGFLAGCSAAQGKLLAGLVQELAAAVQQAAGDLDSPALRTERRAAAAAVERLLRACQLLAQHPGEAAALLQLLEVAGQAEEVLQQQLPQLLEATAAPVLAAALMDALQSAFSRYRDDVCLMQQQCKATCQAAVKALGRHVGSSHPAAHINSSGGTELCS